jgi:hypothetical protein
MKLVPINNPTIAYFATSADEDLYSKFLLGPKLATYTYHLVSSFGHQLTQSYAI